MSNAALTLLDEEHYDVHVDHTLHFQHHATATPRRSMAYKHWRDGEKREKLLKVQILKTVQRKKKLTSEQSPPFWLVAVCYPFLV